MILSEKEGKFTIGQAAPSENDRDKLHKEERKSCFFQLKQKKVG